MHNSFKLRIIKIIQHSFLIILAPFLIYGQDCIDYGEFDEPFCASCAPSGWSIWVNSPQMFDPITNCNGIGQSPTGGTAALFLANASGYSEGISTTITGLTPGNTYNLGFWYFSENCGGVVCCATLDIYVDGFLYSFPDVSEWTLAEMCVEAIGTTMTIEAQSINGGTPGTIYFDDAFCNELTLACCSNKEYSFDFPTSYCEDYGDIILPTISIEGITGTWSIPIINTTVYPGQSVTVAFTPDDMCIDPLDLILQINQFVTPTFSIPLEYCRETNDYISLPINSNEFIFGTWSEYGIYPDDWSQDLITVTFTPDDLNCTEAVDIEILLIDGEDLFFSLPDTICSNSDPFELPPFSLNNIDGGWNIDSIIPANIQDEITINFEAVYECYKEYTHQIVVLDSFELSFDSLSPLCRNSGLILLDSISDQGHLGSWSIPIIDTDTLIQDEIINTWTPIDTQHFCIGDLSFSISITDNIQAEFDLDSSYCQLNSDTIFLNSISNNGVEGIWNLPYFIPSQVDSIKLDLLFNPIDSICSRPYLLTVEIEEALQLNFNLPQDFCSNQDIYIFPTESTEGVTGIWVETQIDPSIMNGDFTNYFIPDEACYLDYEHSFTVVDFISASFDNLDSLCRSENLEILDPFSDQNIEGIWTPSIIDFDTVSSSTITAQWTPLDNLNGCIEDVSLDIEVLEPINPTFDFELQYCNTLSDTVFFPSLSLESYNGEWDVPFIIPSQLNTNLVDILFTPTDLECYAPTFIQIEILDQNQLNFDLKPDYCQTEGFIDLPNNSLEGVSGTWSTNPLDVSMLDGNQSLIFSPNEECTADYVYDFFVYTDTGISFDLPSTICRKDTLITLSPFSLENHEGIWNPNSFNPSLIMGNQVALEWEPIDDLNPCLDIVNIIIDITEPSIPSFSFDLDYCSLDADFVLPTSSDNGITGTWSIPTINPANYSNENINIIFTPSAIQNCVEAIDLDLFVAESVNPIFNLPLAMCWDEAPLTLATISDNGISGSWNINEISPIDYLGQLIDLNFMPDDSACANGYVHQIQIIDEFDLNLNTTPPSNCGVQDASIDLIGMASDLEFSIDNGANWQAESCFKMLGSGTYNILIRSVSFPQCESTLQADISTLTETQIQDVIVQSLTDCSNDNGSIQIIADGLNLEFSIDGGNSWSDDPFFDMLTDGQYDIVVRSKNAIDCFDTGLATLTKPELPIINDVIVSNTSNCAPENGQVVIDMINSNFGDYQYSIDNGQNWQTDNTFNDLSAGDYTILIRLIDYTNCQIQEQVSLIEEDQDLSIPNYEIFQLSDCSATDGSIIFADHFVQIDFSIDGGITWQIKPSFTDLPAGNYQVLLRARMAVNCTNEINFTIDDLPCPCNDLDVSFTNTPVSCERDNNGAIEITNISGYLDPNFQFNWADGNNSLLISNLSTGWYVYDITYDNNCYWQDSIFVEELDPLSFGLQSFDESCPNANDGIIEIINPNGGLEPYSYSIGGEVYQDENIFYNLSPDEYEIFILDDNNCIKSELIELFENPGFELLLPEIIPIELGETTFLNPLIDGSSIDSFSWTPQFGILNPNELIAEISPSETTEYTLTIYYDECIQERTILIEVIDNTTLYLGTAFSPNGDGSNDSFFIQSKETTNLQIQAFEVYDRWGNLVFQKEFPEINNPDHGWDGRFNGQYVTPGVYVYMINILKNNNNQILTGQLTIIR